MPDFLVGPVICDLYLLRFPHILKYETGGQGDGKNRGYQIQLPVATLAAFFGVGQNESKEASFRFATDTVKVHLAHFGNNTHRVRLRPLQNIARPAIVVFERRAIRPALTVALLGKLFRAPLPQGQREAITKAAACCWIFTENLLTFLNRLPGSALTHTDVTQRLRAFWEDRGLTIRTSIMPIECTFYQCVRPAVRFERPPPGATFGCSKQAFLLGLSCYFGGEYGDCHQDQCHALAG